VGISEIYVIISVQDPRERSAKELFEKEKSRREALSETASRLLNYGTVTAGNASWETIKSNMAHHLALSLDQHIVWRLDGRSALAGYHTLPDRVRDTLIALPGITLLRGKETAARILRLFARHCRSGRIPSGFDALGAPQFEAVDTGFWFILAVYRYQEITSDSSLVRELMPSMRAVMGALQKGQAGMALTGALPYIVKAGGTWMEEGHPWRSGYVVDVCALYYNALRVFSELLRSTGHTSRSERMYHESEIAKRAFHEKFWFHEKRLYEAVWPDRRDRSLRPSQILALSLPFPLFEGEEAIGILSSVGRLATDRGLRTLSPDDPSFREEFASSEGETIRQGATVPWLLAPYLSALCSLRGEPGRMQAREILTRFYAHLSEGAIGSVSGVFSSDGRPAGVCFLSGNCCGTVPTPL
jgi:predicted glycogen debranching enzyme